MTAEISRLVLVNALLALAGWGALPLVGVRSAPRRLGLAPLAGLALGGIVSSNLAIVGVALGWFGVAALAAACLVLGRTRASDKLSLARPSVAGVIGSAVLAVVFAHAARAFAVKPFQEWDGWALWGLKAKALWQFGWADPALWDEPFYALFHGAYPLLLPSLEAMDARAMGAFDGRALHVQFLLFAVAAVAALWAVLADRVRPWALWPVLVAVFAAPELLGQLITAYADVPLALFFACGFVAAGRWLVDDEDWALAVAALMFGAATLMKNEGTLFAALAAFVLLALVWRGPRRQIRRLALAGAATVAVSIPWRIYVEVYDLTGGNQQFANSFRPSWLEDHVGIAPIALRALGGELLSPARWGLLVPLFLFACGLLIWRGPRRVALFAGAWSVAALAVLCWTYVTSELPHGQLLATTQERVVATIAISVGAVSPLLIAEIDAGARGRRVARRPIASNAAPTRRRRRAARAVR